MKRLFLMLVAASSLGLAACGGGEVVVQASVERADGSTTALKGLVVRALPYDRDEIFSEAEKTYGTPQPPIPDSLMALRNEISKAQEEWSNAETLWGAARDSLKVLSDKMKTMNRASAQYNLAFRDFNAQDAVVRRTEATSKSAFARFTSLSERYNREAEAVRLSRAQWADEAYAKVDSVIAARKVENGLKEYADTTDANGIATFKGLKGKYWIHARYDLPYDELYWNVPVEAKGGDPIPIQLNKSNAQVRPKL